MSRSRPRYSERMQKYEDALDVGSSHDRSTAHLARVGESVGDTATDPDGTFVIGLRAKLMREASSTANAGKRARSTEPKPDQTRTVPARGPRKKVVAIVTSTTVTLGGLGVLGGSVSAMPGEALYPIKRGFENSRIALAHDPATLGEQHLRLAARRLDETKQLAIPSKSEKNTPLISSTLSAFAIEAEKGARLLFEAYGASHENHDIEKTTQFLQEYSESLEELSRIIPNESGRSYETAVETVHKLHAKATNICPGCSIASLTDLPTSLGAAELQNGDDFDGPLLSAPHSEELKSQLDNSEKPKAREADKSSPDDQSGERKNEDNSGAQPSDERKSTDSDQDDEEGENSDEAADESSGPLQRFFSPLSEGFKSLTEKPDVDSGDESGKDDDTDNPE